MRSIAVASGRKLRAVSAGLALLAFAVPASAAPLVDHHQHLLSPAGAEMLNRAPDPADPIPADIQAVLDARAANWNEAAPLSLLYTDDATALNADMTGYVRGATEVADYLSKLFARSHRLTPLAYTATRDAAQLYGYYSRDTETGIRHFGHFTLRLARHADGTWRIASENGIFPGPNMEEPITAERLIGTLNEAGIKRAAVLSVAYWFGKPSLPDTAETYARVRAENDWTLEQAKLYPDRLVAFCSVNPLRSHAVAELERCASRGMKGLKLHFVNSEVDLTRSDHRERIKTLFAAANRLRMPIIVHARTAGDYGSNEVEILLNEVMPVAPDIVVQVAHLWGGGGYSAEALARFAEAFEARHPSTRNLYFDLADAAANGAARSPEQAQEIVRHMRVIGMDRMLYGSDAAIQGHDDAAAAWAKFVKHMPITDAEMRTIEGNVAPYLRH